ncbi:hypothetical protein EV586_103305 [Tumebacillus sp. BK434]|nr:hypothetical protein [Tumebacillus sp. BK434]TCP55652.1 hypothetical protein EV586_103305 [Tumebacillus sp. BK434]
MIKRIVLSGLILTCALTFTGCGESDHGDHAAAPATGAQHHHN